MRIVLAHQSGIPIYEQIKEQIKDSVLSGELPENELLPSIRQLARDLKVSVITTTGHITIWKSRDLYKQYRVKVVTLKKSMMI